MSRKLIAFDIDGTLLTSQQEIQTSTFEVIEKLKNAGHMVTIATGRSLPTAQEVIDQVKFDNYVLCNGAYAFVKGEQIFSNPIDKGELKEIVSLANHHQIDMLYQTMEEVKQQGPFIHLKNQELQDNFNARTPSFDFNIDNEEAIYQAVIFCDRVESEVFANRFQKIRFTRWGEEAMDATPVNGSKAVTLAQMARDYGFQQKDIVAFGDGDNDIEMLQLAGLGIAMGNASDGVKGFANHVTKSNDEHGIWYAAKEHGLI